MLKTVCIDGRELAITPVVEHARAYAPGKHYIARDSWSAIVTLTYVGDDECYAAGGLGTVDGFALRALKQYLRESGCKLLRYEHAGKDYICDLLSDAAIRRLNQAVKEPPLSSGDYGG